MLLYLVHSKVVNIKYYFRLLYNNKMLINFSQLFPKCTCNINEQQQAAAFCISFVSLRPCSCGWWKAPENYKYLYQMTETQ